MDGSQSHPEHRAIASCKGRAGARRELWGPTVAGTFCFPKDGRDLGADRVALYRRAHTRTVALLLLLACLIHSSVVKARHSSQILICRATQSLGLIIRHDDLCLADV